MDLPDLIDEPEQLDEVLRVIEPLEVLAIDTEFLWERTYYPRLALVQVGGRDSEGEIVAFALDALELDLDPLVELLEDRNRLKLVHAGRIDLQILNRMSETLLQPVFDSQRAASLLGFGAQIGYANLVESLTGKRLKKTEQYTDWTKRPLRKEQVDYALLDVVYLLQAHDVLSKQLEKAGRTAWAEEEMADLVDPGTYVEENPEELYLKIKNRKVLDRRGLGVLRELASWRDDEARRRDLRPSFVVRDSALVEMAGRRPKNIDALQDVRGLHKGEVRRNGKKILDCVERAIRLPEKDLPTKPSRKGRRKEVGAAVDLLRAFLNQRAVEVGVAAETLATVSELERLARDGSRERYAKDHPVLIGWRRELVGEDMLRILKGKLTLGVDPNASTLRLIESEQTEQEQTVTPEGPATPDFASGEADSAG